MLCRWVPRRRLLRPDKPAFECRLLLDETRTRSDHFVAPYMLGAFAFGSTGDRSRLFLERLTSCSGRHGLPSSSMGASGTVAQRT